MPRRRGGRNRLFWFALTFLVCLAGFGTWKFFNVKADKPRYLFATVVEGNIISQVVAQGTLAAVTTVDVGSQVSGTIGELYADFNSQVKKGQVLAKLQPDLFQADVDQQEANVRTAEATLGDDQASIASSEANLQAAKVDEVDKQRKFARQKELFEQSLISQDDYETAQAALDSSVAAREAAESQISSVKARYNEDQSRLIQARAVLQNARVNLEHSVITSPISGTVISRSVDRGQTVAASYASPTLFTIGGDLTKMKVDTNIDEADVGKLKPGMTATFTVDAYNGVTFSGTLAQIRLAATTVQNVVTYDAVINVANDDLKLKPGMTANVKIVTETVENVLKIPNSALRYLPSLTEAEMEAVFKKAGEEKFWASYKEVFKAQVALRETAATGAQNTRDRNAGATPASQTKRSPSSDISLPTRGRRIPLWLVGEDKAPRPVIVKLGATDGVSTQLLESQLKPGDRIVVGLEFDPTHSASSSQLPFFGGMRRLGR